MKTMRLLVRKKKLRGELEKNMVRKYLHKHVSQ